MVTSVPDSSKSISWNSMFQFLASSATSHAINTKLIGKGGYQLAREVEVDDPLADPQSIVNSQTHSSPTNTVA